MSVICADTGDHVNVHNPLSPVTVCKSMVSAPTDYEEQGSYFAIVLMPADPWLRKWDIEGVL